ncbi:MAG: hypothetical protein E6I76_16820, partial [Chloroflexi bacterium]
MAGAAHHVGVETAGEVDDVEVGGGAGHGLVVLDDGEAAPVRRGGRLEIGGLGAAVGHRSAARRRAAGGGEDSGRRRRLAVGKRAQSGEEHHRGRLATEAGEDEGVLPAAQPAGPEAQLCLLLEGLEVLVAGAGADAHGVRRLGV